MVADKYPDGWQSGCWIGAIRCEECGQPWREHPDFRPSGDSHSSPHRFLCPDTGASFQSLMVSLFRERSGAYDAPLPPPSERRTIREAARLSQEDVAERIGVSRSAMRLYERPAGYRNRRRLVQTSPL